MRKNRLFKLLTNLNPWEIRNFKQFLASPFFNQRKDVQQLLDYYRMLRKGEKQNWTKEAAFAFVFPEKKYKDQEMRLLSSRLFQLLQEYLAMRSILADESLKKIHLAKAYRQLKLEKAFSKSLDQHRHFLEKQIYRNAAYYRQQYELEYEYNDFITGEVRSLYSSLQTVSDIFDTYFIVEKLKNACLLTAKKTVFKKAYHFGLLKEVLQFIQAQPNLLDIPAIALYYHCYQSLTAQNSEFHFQQFRELIEVHQTKFTEREIRDIYLLAINFCIKRLNTGEQYYLKEGFELYRFGLEKKILIENGLVSPFTFKNTVALGLHLKEYTWVENFIKTFQKNLHPKFRVTTTNFNLAKLYYEQQKYKQAMRLLVHFDSTDYLMTLGAKTILLKMYYELEEWNALEALLESMRMYLQRKEVLGYHKQHFENILHFTRQMMELTDFDAAGRQQLKEQINQTKIQSERAWFLKQLAGK